MPISADPERLFEAAIETMIDGFGIFTAVRGAGGRIVDFRVAYANAAGRELFGFADPARLGGTIGELWPGYRESSLFDAHIAVVETGWPLLLRQRVIPIPTPPGERLVDLKAARLGDGFVTTIRDLTEIHDTLSALASDRAELTAARDDLERQTVELQRSNAALREFAQVVSHDLTEPLGTFGLFVERLAQLDGEPAGGERRELIDGLRLGVERMSTLIDDLLASARDAQKPAATSVDMEAVVREAAEAVQRRIEERGARVVTDGLPQVTGHRGQLARLMQNLLANALAYAHPERTPEIRISAVRRDGLWEFAVADNGIGIAFEHARDVFQPFKRLGESTGVKGTGLGLAICQAIVDGHGGRIWISEQPGIGTTVCFQLADGESAVRAAV